MPLTKRSLVLPASPPSVKLARSWVSKILSEIGREDLVDAAQLGVSELVTNALIHSQPPLSVRVRGTVDHPRIEVVDSSPVPPQRAPVAPEPEEVDDFNVTTFGRGLDLVAMMSSRWGSDLAHDGRSKSVWFEPSRDARIEEHLEGEVFTFDPDLADGPEILEGDRMTMHLLGVPARLFGELRRYHFEVRRELRLLAMTAPDDYPLATRITDIFVQADRERRSSAGISRLDEAIARGIASIDLDYEVPLSTPATMARIRDLLDEVYQAFSSDHLLALRPPDVLVAAAGLVLQRVRATGPGRGTDPLGRPHGDVGRRLGSSAMAATPRTGPDPVPVLLGCFLTAAGGAVGAVARWGLQNAFPASAGQFPWTTFLINVIGCALLAALPLALARRQRRLARRPGGTRTAGRLHDDVGRLGRDRDARSR